MGGHEGSWSPMATSEQGAVTAEAAMVLPVLVAVAMGLVWVVALAATQVRVVDASREAVRVAARGEGDAAAVAEGRRVAPEGTRFAVGRSGGLVRVTAVSAVRGPGGLFGFLPAVSVRAEAVAAEEPR